MANLTRMRQLEEHQVEREVDDVVWSPKMDILAVTWKTDKELSLYRLKWQKLWTFSPSDTNCTSLSVVWRPDGKLLAIGCKPGSVAILDVESHIPLCTHTIEGPVSCLSWSAVKPQTTENNKEMEPDGNWDFLTHFPSISKSWSGSEVKEECQKLHDGGSTTVLAVGTENGLLHVFMDGFLYCARIDINTLVPIPCCLANISMSPHQLGLFSITCKPQSENRLRGDANLDEGFLKVVTMRIPLFASCVEELKTITDFYCKSTGILNYMSETLKQIQESWESVLLEMDSKLESFASNLPEDGVAADFLELFLFGIPSPELETFLQVDLTEKGLKKFEQSIEASYSNIERLVLTYLNTVSQSLSFHLSELVGFCRANKKFEVIGVHEDTVLEVEQNAAKFWSKGLEVLQVLDYGMKSFKAFFRWLAVEIRKISDQSLVEDLMKVSQQEIRFIAEFLSSFSSSNSRLGSRSRYLERVEQYLKGDVRHNSLSVSGNPWSKFLEENPDITKLPFILCPDKRTSPVKELENLKISMEAVFRGINLSTEGCSLNLRDLKVSHTHRQMETRQFECATSGKVIGMLIFRSEDSQSSDQLFFYEVEPDDVSVKALWLTVVGGPNTDMKLIDAQFYTSEVVCLLIGTTQNNDESHQMIELNYSAIASHLSELKFSTFSQLDLTNSTPGLKTLSLFDFEDETCHRDLEHSLVAKFSVSGPRKVASFLFRNLRRIRIYDMDQTEEDDLDEDTLGTSELNSSDVNTSS